MREHVVVIDPAGAVRFIHDDDLAEALEPLGAATTQRASHVEPLPGGGWGADMSPVGGPVLAPQARRGGALEAERVWLESHNVPRPRP
jgi:hypothetical protein